MNIRILVCMLSVSFLIQTAFATDKTFKKSVSCFSSLVKRIDKDSGSFQYYTLPKTFIFPKSFVMDETGSKEGFYLVGAEQTQFCPFHFSVPTYGKKHTVRSKFQVQVNNTLYKMSYDHKKRQFQASKGLLNTFIGRMPASVGPKPLKCETVVEHPESPLNKRISWLIQRFGETYYRKKDAGKKTYIHKYKAVLRACEKIDPKIDRLIQKFPGKKPKKRQYSSIYSSWKN